MKNDLSLCYVSQWLWYGRRKITWLRHNHQIRISLPVRSQSLPNTTGVADGNEKTSDGGRGGHYPTAHIISRIRCFTPQCDMPRLELFHWSSAIAGSNIFPYIPINANTCHFIDDHNSEIILTWLDFHHPTI